MSRRPATPGLVLAALIAGQLGLVGSDLEKALIAQTPLGRTGKVGDIAPIAVFLASNESAWLTGEQLLGTGGIR